MKITVEVLVNADVQHVWNCFTQPEHIMQWNHAGDDWHCPAAQNDLRVGGTFSYTMAAKDGSFSFDFGGTYTDVNAPKNFDYILGDTRAVQLVFTEEAEGTRVTETFDTENEHPAEMQQMGWQMILTNFKKHAEAVLAK
ncbi:MAG: hypothetical protein RLZZ543_393 [Bacteroidota bacterium]|jgi:uncharacterized protein YndB with AHSA1/START domain